MKTLLEDSYWSHLKRPQSEKRPQDWIQQYLLGGRSLESHFPSTTWILLEVWNKFSTSKWILLWSALNGHIYLKCVEKRKEDPRVNKTEVKRKLLQIYGKITSRTKCHGSRLTEYKSFFQNENFFFWIVTNFITDPYFSGFWNAYGSEI